MTWPCPRAGQDQLHPPKGRPRRKPPSGSLWNQVHRLRSELILGPARPWPFGDQRAVPCWDPLNIPYRGPLLQGRETELTFYRHKNTNRYLQWDGRGICFGWRNKIYPRRTTKWHGDRQSTREFTAVIVKFTEVIPRSKTLGKEQMHTAKSYL